VAGAIKTEVDQKYQYISSMLKSVSDVSSQVKANAASIKSTLNGMAGQVSGTLKDSLSFENRAASALEGFNVYSCQLSDVTFFRLSTILMEFA
jgi:uncharacterized protein YoxC